MFKSDLRVERDLGGMPDDAARYYRHGHVGSYRDRLLAGDYDGRVPAQLDEVDIEHLASVDEPLRQPFPEPCPREGSAGARAHFANALCHEPEPSLAVALVLRVGGVRASI